MASSSFSICTYLFWASMSAHVPWVNSFYLAERLLRYLLSWHQLKVSLVSVHQRVSVLKHWSANSSFFRSFLVALPPSATEHHLLAAFEEEHWRQINLDWILIVIVTQLLSPFIKYNPIKQHNRLNPALELKKNNTAFFRYCHRVATISISNQPIVTRSGSSAHSFTIACSDWLHLHLLISTPLYGLVVPYTNRLRMPLTWILFYRLGSRLLSSAFILSVCVFHHSTCKDIPVTLSKSSFTSQSFLTHH